MRTREAMETLAASREDVVVVCSLGMAANEWWAVTESDDAFYLHGAMGFASSFGLGIALTLPDQPVWVLDGDGSLSMNLGCLLTEAGSRPSNFTHFVVANRCYQTVGASPMVGLSHCDYSAIAAGAGADKAFTVSECQEIEARLDEFVAPGYRVVVLEVECEDLPVVPPPQPYEGAEMKYRFGRAMERRFNIEVFGPEGY